MRNRNNKYFSPSSFEQILNNGEIEELLHILAVTGQTSYTTSISALSTMNNLKMLNLDFTEPEGASNDCCIVFREGDPMRDTVQEALDKLNWNDKAEFDKLMDEMVKLQPSSN